MKKEKNKTKKNSFSLRQQKYKLNRLKGMSQYNSARSAGYSENYARKGGSRIEKLVKDGIQEALEQAGFTDKKIAELVMKWITCENGKVAHSFFRTACEMTGRIKGGGVNVDIKNTSIKTIHHNETIVFSDIDDDLDGVYGTEEDSSEIHASEGAEGNRLP